MSNDMQKAKAEWDRVSKEREAADGKAAGNYLRGNYDRNPFCKIEMRVINRLSAEKLGVGKYHDGRGK